MYTKLQYIGEHLQNVANISYIVVHADSELPETCMIPSCSICRSCPLETKIYAYTHRHGIQDVLCSNSTKQIYDCQMGFLFCALVTATEAGEKYALILGPIVSGELHDGLYQSFSPELDRAVSRSRHMSTLQIHGLLELAKLCLHASGISSLKFETGKMPAGQAPDTSFKSIAEKYRPYLPFRDTFVLSRMEQLRNLINSGNQHEIEKSITELVNRLYIENSTQLNVFKARSIQLIEMFGKAIIDQGQDASEILSNISDLLHHLDVLNSGDTLCIWLKDTMLRFSVIALQRFHIVYRDAVSKTIQFLHANWDKKISLDTVADATYLSKAYLCTLFKREMSMSILEYLTRLRIEKAKELLGGNGTLAEIAERCCFFDQSYFSKVFRKYTGYTPKKWREQLSAQSDHMLHNLEK